MPRISQDQTKERHAFLLELFQQQPELTPKEALASFRERFDATISPKILNQLREQARSESSHQAADQEPSQLEMGDGEEAGSRLNGSSGAAATAQLTQRSKGKGARQKNVFIDGSREHLAFLEKIVRQLQEAGATNVRIDHATDRWMVLQVDAK